LIGGKGPKGDKGDKGYKADSGTISGDLDMNDHCLTGLPVPTQDSDAATKKWVTDDFPTKQEVLGGFTLIGPLDLENNEIFGVDDPSTDKSEVNKQYFDQRGDFYNNVTFHSGVFCHELDSSTSQESSVVNKESLETGGWVGLRSLKTTLQKKFAPMFDTEVCAAFVKGNVASYTTVCKDSSLVNTVALTK